MRALGGPGVRFALASATLGLTTRVVRNGDVRPTEERFFRAVNDLPGVGFPLAWLIMQCGNAAAVPVAALAALAGGDRRLAARLFVTGTTTWALAKAIKRQARRPRPEVLLPAVRCLGGEHRGLGYVSGHAGVVVSLTATALPRLGPGARAGVLVLAPAAALARLYVGAHLPLDIAGGAALGLGVEALVSWVGNFTEAVTVQLTSSRRPSGSDGARRRGRS